jgi:hypothetical protein
MEIALYAAGALALALGIAGVVLPAIPGSVLLVVGVVLVAWAEGFTRVGWPTITATVLLSALIWATDWVAAVLGAKAFGASKWSILGAGVGLVLGMFLGLPGIILGPAVGAVAFEYWKNPNFEKALKAGAGAFLGFVVGSAVKVALAFVVLGILGFALFV